MAILVLDLDSQVEDGSKIQKIDLNNLFLFKSYYDTMNIEESKTKIENLQKELSTAEDCIRNYKREYSEISKKIRLCENINSDLLKQIKHLETIVESENAVETVKYIEGFDSLSQEELVSISNGMDQTDYRKHNNTLPRFYDLERLIKEVIEIKKQYPGWILDKVQKTGHYDTLPPQSFYNFTFKTHLGHYMSFGGIKIIRC